MLLIWDKDTQLRLLWVKLYEKFGDPGLFVAVAATHVPHYVIVAQMSGTGTGLVLLLRLKLPDIDLTESDIFAIVYHFRR